MSAQILAALISGAVIGALLTAVTSLFTGWLSRRHDHRRWLLDKRLEAYIAFNQQLWVCTDQLKRAPWTAPKDPLPRMLDLTDTVILVAPFPTIDLTHAVYAKAMELFMEQGEDDQEALIDELGELSSRLTVQQRQDVQDMGLFARIRSRRTLARLGNEAA